jgi:uncharacterized protein (TIGR01777 family)
MGNLLIGNLLENGHEITVITRNASRVENSWKDRVNLIEGSLYEKGEWVEHLQDHDAIVNLVGENIFGKRWTSKQKDRIMTSRSVTTSNLVAAVNEMTSPPGVFVSVSGTDYYPASETKLYTEEDDPSDSFAGMVTQEWEKPLKDLDPDKVRAVIFRMGINFGYSGAGGERMFLTHKLFVGGWVGSGKQIYSWIHMHDFVGLLEWSLENPEVRGAYNGVAPEPKTMKELAVIGGKAMGRWTWTWAPGFALKIILGSRAALILEGRGVSAQKVIDAGYTFKFPDAQSAMEDIVANY